MVGCSDCNTGSYLTSHIPDTRCAHAPVLTHKYTYLYGIPGLFTLRKCLNSHVLAPTSTTARPLKVQGWKGNSQTANQGPTGIYGGKFPERTNQGIVLGVHLRVRLIENHGVAAQFEVASKV